MTFSPIGISTEFTIRRKTVITEEQQLTEAVFLIKAEDSDKIKKAALRLLFLFYIMHFFLAELITGFRFFRRMPDMDYVERNDFFRK